METTDYCDYKLSLGLKAAGFDEPCNYGYSVKMRLEPEVSFGEPKVVHSKDPKNYNDNRKGIEKGLSFCSAPTLWQAQKWLRERAIEVDVTPIFSHGGRDGYDWDVYDDFSGYSAFRGTLPFAETYEQALSAGIVAALEQIKNKNNMTGQEIRGFMQENLKNAGLQESINKISEMLVEAYDKGFNDAMDLIHKIHNQYK